MAAKITATPQGTGEGTPKTENPTAASNPWARGTTTIACRTPFTVLPRWSKIWVSWFSEKGETWRSSARSRPPSRRRKKSMNRKRASSKAAAVKPATSCWTRALAAPASCDNPSETRGMSWSCPRSSQRRRTGMRSGSVSFRIFSSASG